MNFRTLRRCIPAGLCLLSNVVLANPIPPGHWQCVAIDAKDKSYESLGLSMLHAMETATSRCKRESKHSNTCKTAQSFCEQGPLSLNADRCLVTDAAGRSWTATGTDACKTALELCNRFQYLHGISSPCTVKHDT